MSSKALTDTVLQYE